MVVLRPRASQVSSALYGPTRRGAASSSLWENPEGRSQRYGTRLAPRKAVNPGVQVHAGTPVKGLPWSPQEVSCSQVQTPDQHLGVVRSLVEIQNPAPPTPAKPESVF